MEVGVCQLRLPDTATLNPRREDSRSSLLNRCYDKPDRGCVGLASSARKK
jgi:hypothetical protein